MFIPKDDFKNLLSVVVAVERKTSEHQEALIRNFREYAGKFFDCQREQGGLIVDDSKMVQLSFQLNLPVNECLNQAVADEAYDSWMIAYDDYMSDDEREFAELMVVTPFTEEHRSEKAKLH